MLGLYPRSPLVQHVWSDESRLHVHALGINKRARCPSTDKFGVFIFLKK